MPLTLKIILIRRNNMLPLTDIPYVKITVVLFETKKLSYPVNSKINIILHRGANL